ncbi:hypothetical protein BHE74_00021086 [Ensete ventricosum]|nr:hypothetical protein GW17_00026212 [Ensete ventricosum]RWW71183.1 hypothetical protein BHE74_00021086 [Ensete ventricosum]
MAEVARRVWVLGPTVRRRVLYISRPEPGTGPVGADPKALTSSLALPPSLPLSLLGRWRNRWNSPAGWRSCPSGTRSCCLVPSSESAALRRAGNPLRSIYVIVVCCSVKLVEQELWQKEEKGLIGVLPVRDTEAAGVGSMIAPGDLVLQFHFPVDTV